MKAIKVEGSFLPVISVGILARGHGGSVPPRRCRGAPSSVEGATGLGRVSDATRWGEVACGRVAYVTAIVLPQATLVLGSGCPGPALACHVLQPPSGASAVVTPGSPRDRGAGRPRRLPEAEEQG